MSKLLSFQTISLIPASVTEYRCLAHLHEPPSGTCPKLSSFLSKNDNLQLSTKFYFLGYLSQRSDEVLECQVPRCLRNILMAPESMLSFHSHVYCAHLGHHYCLSNTAIIYSQMSWSSSLPHCFFVGGESFKMTIRNQRLYLCTTVLYPTWDPLALVSTISRALTDSKFKLWTKHTQHLALSKWCKDHSDLSLNYAVLIPSSGEHPLHTSLAAFYLRRQVKCRCCLAQQAWAASGIYCLVKVL